MPCPPFVVMNTHRGGGILAFNLASTREVLEMLHWKTKITYVAATALLVLSAILGDFDGWAW